MYRYVYKVRDEVGVYGICVQMVSEWYEDYTSEKGGGSDKWFERVR